MCMQKGFETGLPHIKNLAYLTIHCALKFSIQVLELKPCFYSSVIVKIRFCTTWIDKKLPIESVSTQNVNSLLLLLQISSYFVLIFTGKRLSALPALHFLIRYPARQLRYHSLTSLHLDANSNFCPHFQSKAFLKHQTESCNHQKCKGYSYSYTYYSHSVSLTHCYFWSKDASPVWLWR